MKNIIITLKKIWQSEFRWMIVVVTLLAFISGYWVNNGQGANSINHSDQTHATTTDSDQIWTCSMHPQIRQPQAGQCPICGMDLIPVSNSGGEDLGPRQLKLSTNAVKLAEITTAPAIRQNVEHEIRMVGKIGYDETRTKYISAYVPGRIERLYVDYTGTTVRKGDHLVLLYSPELISAQEELLQAKRTLRELGSNSAPALRENIANTVTAAREKLYLLGLTKRQIQNIEDRNEVNDRLTIYSPISGIVIHRNATEGMYVKTGTRIYTVADLTHLWVNLEAYESDLSWLRYGQNVEFSVEAYPGEIFSGQVSFIDPVLNPNTRTVKIRVNVKNNDSLLKPEMFVRAVVKSKLSRAGKILSPELAGKWISPMHPEIIKDGPGSCDVCGMSLVRIEDMGYITADESVSEIPLVIPASAPLRTGRRAVVYIADQEAPGLFEGRDVVLGPRTGDYYIVQSGLQEGERVVTNGNFKLDSDLQIKAQPSMMNPDGGGPVPGHQHGQAQPAIENQSAPLKVSDEFQATLSELFQVYFDIQRALAGDTLMPVTRAAKEFQNRLTKIDMKLLDGPAHQKWMQLLLGLQSNADAMSNTTRIADARKSFKPLSDDLYSALKSFQLKMDVPLYRMHCPMAFDNTGADWLQDHDRLQNPYFGAAMLRCGDQVEVIGATNDPEKGHNHD